MTLGVAHRMSEHGYSRQLPFSAVKGFVLAVSLILSAGPARSQQMAVTFDDLPVHGALPAGMTRLRIAQSILTTLKQEKMPPVYGFINGGRVQRIPARFRS